MRQWTISAIGVVLAASSVASASQVIAPVAWGPTTNTYPDLWNAYTGLTGGEHMFDGHGSTSFANGVVTSTILDTGLIHGIATANVVGGAAAITDYGNWGTPSCMDNYNGWFSTSAWIDFGANYASVRIEQTWTHVYQDNFAGRDNNRGGAQPFLELFWDNDNDSAKSTSAVAETRFNFVTQATQAAGTWAKDTDLTGSPVTPSARYLILKAPFPTAPPVDEFAFVGTIVPVPEPATAGLLVVAATGLALRRSRRHV